VTDKRTIRLIGKTQREHACETILRAPDGYVAVIREETRTDAQNRLMWPLIKDMRDQIDGMDTYTPDQTKLRFLNALDNEMQFLPELEGGGMFLVGQRSSTLTKGVFRDLIETMYMFGSKYEVAWSQKAKDTIDEVLTARKTT
jgi:hypothetical protein